MEEICLSKKNGNSGNCSLKPDIAEIKALLSEMKAEILELRERLGKTVLCTNDSQPVKGKPMSEIFFFTTLVY